MGGLLLRLYVPYGSQEGTGCFARHQFQAALVPMRGVVWEQRGRAAGGGSGWVGQSDSFVWKE